MGNSECRTLFESTILTLDKQWEKELAFTTGVIVNSSKTALAFAC